MGVVDLVQGLAVVVIESQIGHCGGLCEEVRGRGGEAAAAATAALAMVWRVYVVVVTVAVVAVAVDSIFAGGRVVAGVEDEGARARGGLLGLGGDALAAVRAGGGGMIPLARMGCGVLRECLVHDEKVICARVVVYPG